MKNMASAFRSHKASIWLLLGINVAFYMAMQFPLLSILLSPLDTFVTTLHEMGHATACMLTGGSVSGLTIVSDGAGAAGLTWCSGGIRWITICSGYLGASFAGCILIWLGREDKNAKPVLLGLGAFIGFGSLFWMGSGIFYNGIGPGQAFESVVIGLIICAVLVVAGLKLGPTSAHLVLLVLGGQTALNAVRDIVNLIEIHMGYYGGTAHSDAYNMARLMGGTATMWSMIWCGMAIAMVYFTLKLAYGGENSNRSGS